MEGESYRLRESLRCREGRALVGVAVRPAAEGDLPEVYDVFYEHEVGDDPDPPPRGDVPSFLRHELETGEMRVAERDGRILGFASLITRGRVSYLAELFVRRSEQSAGVGKLLLRDILAADEGTRCTLSSTDPRALALYVRAGMQPRWPNVWLRADTARLDELPRGGVEVVEAQAGDPELMRWDAEVGGRYRPEEHEYWVREGALPVWFERSGRRIGYGYLQMRSPSALWSRDAITVGPVGANVPSDASDCVCAAVEHAQGLSRLLRLAVPGPHPALRSLLEAGFYITYVETFAAADVANILDPARYVGSGVFL